MGNHLQNHKKNTVYLLKTAALEGSLQTGSHTVAWSKSISLNSVKPFHFDGFNCISNFNKYEMPFSVHASCSVYFGTEGCQPIQGGTVHSLR